LYSRLRSESKCRFKSAPPGRGSRERWRDFPKWGCLSPLALFVVLAEFIGSLALISGAFARIASAAILLLMAGAIATVHAQFGFYMNPVQSAKR
jgi:uncharacterized membrane protein YphA (DoxX/SURF4 family)